MSSAAPLTLPRVGFGVSRVGGGLHGGSPAETTAILRRALEAGITLFDTADIYGQGQSEILLGRVLAGHRDGVILATKGGYRFSAAAGWLARLKPLLRPLAALRPGLGRSVQKVRSSQLSQDFSAAHLTRALEGSLRRLRTPWIDLYQLHSPPPEVLQCGEVFEVLAGLQRSGKIRHYGVACRQPEHALHCRGHGVAAVQLELNFLEVRALPHVLGALREDGIQVIARQVMASGRLLRNPDDWTAADFGGDEASLSVARHRVAELRRYGELAPLSLQFWSGHGGISSMLFGTTRMANLEKNLHTLRQPALAASQRSAIEASLASNS